MNFKSIPITFILLITSLTATSQSFPITVNTLLNPPYSVQLSKFGNPESTNLIAQVTLNDISIPALDVRLILTIKGNGITIQTNPGFIPLAPITLEGGTPQNIMGSDLSEYLSADNLLFDGYSREEFRRTGRVPEGFYEISFQAVEYRRGVSVSNPNPPIKGIGWFVEHDPPFVVYPEEGDTLIAKNPQYVVFQWQPRHIGTPGASFTTEYIFQLVEIWPVNRNPNDAFLTSNVLYETTTLTTNIAYTVAEPQLVSGRKYAIRVRAREFDPAAALDAPGSFKNNGYSQVVSFTYIEDCPAPYYVNAQINGPSSIRLDWTTPAEISAVDVRFEVEGGQNIYWKKGVQENEVILDKFQADQVVTYQIQSVCEHNTSEFTLPKSIRLPKEKEKNSAGTISSCGTSGPQNKSIENALPLEKLNEGDEIDAHGLKIYVNKVTGSFGEGSFSGTGTVGFPFLEGLEGNGTFTRMKVSEEYQLLKGEFVLTGGKIQILKNTPAKDIIKAMEKVAPYLDKAKALLADRKNNKDNSGGNSGGGGLNLNIDLNDAIGAMGDAAEATAEAIAKVPQLAANIPGATYDAMAKLKEESADLIKEAAAIVGDAPEAAAELVAQAGEKLEEVANTLSGLPGVVEGAVTGLAGFIKDTPSFLKEVLDSLSIEQLNISLRLGGKTGGKRNDLIEVCYATRMSIEQYVTSNELLSISSLTEENREQDELDLPKIGPYIDINKGYLELRVSVLDEAFAILKKLTYLRLLEPNMLDKLGKEITKGASETAPDFLKTNSTVEKKAFIKNYIMEKVDKVLEEKQGGFINKLTTELDNGISSERLLKLIEDYMVNEVATKL